MIDTLTMAWRTLLDALRERAASQPSRPALWHKQGDGPYRPWTWHDLQSMASRFGRGLLALGIPADRAMATLVSHRPEWLPVELGAMGAGFRPAALFDRWPDAHVVDVLKRLESAIVVVDTGAQLDRLRGLRARLPALRLAVSLEAPAAPEEWVRSFSEVLSLGDAAPEEAFFARVAAIDPDSIAAMALTPGTCDAPKILQHTHAALLAHAHRFARSSRLSQDDAVLARLPPALSFERSVLHLALFCGAQTYCAPGHGSFQAQLKDARPTFVHAPPEDWETLRRAVEEHLAAESPSRKRVAAWAHEAHRLDDEYLAVPGPTLAKYKLGQGLVFQPLKLEFGLHAGKRFLCGLAPVRRGTLDFFTSLDVALDECWGLTEAGGPVTLNFKSSRRLGAQGRPLPGIAVRIAGDGEILLQGDTRCAEPGALFDRQGSLRTGDLGELDSDGFLHVLGRKEEQLTLRGRRKAPARLIEARLAAVPLVEKAIAIADGRAPVALLSLDRERCAHFAREQGLPDDPAQLAVDPTLAEKLAKELALAQVDAPEAERVERFAVVPDGFSLEEGERTPAGTLCRKVVEERRAHLIEPLLARAHAAKG